MKYFIIGLAVSASLTACQETNITPTHSPKDNVPIHDVAPPATYQNIAAEFAQTAEIYVQDGHNLQLANARKGSCETCYIYEFSFDHYGDPDVPYSLNVEVKNGQPQWAD